MRAEKVAVDVAYLNARESVPPRAGEAVTLHFLAGSCLLLRGRGGWRAPGARLLLLA